MNKKILLLSAYDASSHKLWRERLATMFPDDDWTQLTLAPRNFNWRIRGNSLQWGFGEYEQLDADYDLLIATSMVDLSSLRGFRPSLAKIPSIVYFHENQFAYPVGSRQRSDNIEPQLIPIYTALCANSIVFNSEYNRSTFLSGARSLFKKLPDEIPSELLVKLEKSEVIPVPLAETKTSDEKSGDKNILEVVWNHRWEYDKGPELLLQLIEFITQQERPIRLHVVGEQFREMPTEFEQMKTLLHQHADALSFKLGKFGFIASQERYRTLLNSCDIVLSTALHDFQGLAIQEACQLGCTPLVPDALVYPEYLSGDFLYPHLGSAKSTAQHMLDRLMQFHAMKLAEFDLPKAELQFYSANNLREKYQSLFSRLTSKQ